MLEESAMMKNRTSTYKAIQKLVEVNIVEIKKYVLKGRKRIIYYLKKKHVILT
jgi:predicted transcriptional regulator